MSFFAEVAYFFKAGPSCLYGLRASRLIPLAACETAAQERPLSQEDVSALARGLWTPQSDGVLLPILYEGRLLGALYLQAGAPSRSSGPVWTHLERLLAKMVILQARRERPAEELRDETAAAKPQLSAMAVRGIEKALAQGLHCCMVRLMAGRDSAEAKAQGLEQLRSLLPDESWIIDGEFPVVVFTSAVPVDRELYTYLFTKYVVENPQYTGLWTSFELRTITTIQDLLSWTRDE